MNNIYLRSWYRHVASLQLSLIISDFISRIEIRGYKIVRAYGSGLPLAIAGNGIPQKILDKIFQPFFTTKPTGQGTGLGLSLSYDIVKAHGGELKVETKHVEGLPAGASAQAGSEFIITIPII